MRKYLPEILFSVALVATVTLSFTIGQTNTAKQEASIASEPLKEHFLMRRNYFFGHKEMSDTISGLSILAATIDAYSNYSEEDFGNSKVRLRFEESLKIIPSLSKYAIGMNDVYLLPAIFFVFVEEDPLRSMALVELAINDSRTTARAVLLGAFVSHVLIRNLQRAGELYKEIREKHNGPEWLETLAVQLLAGNDPYLTNPKLNGKLNAIINKSFPRSKAFFERQEALRIGGKQK
jgi:hypothetical protein